MGEANEVPRTSAYPWCGPAAAMSAPGAANFTCAPRSASTSTCWRASTAVTPTTPGQAAGYSGGAAGPSLPTAATTRWPRASTFCTMPASVLFGGPTRLTLMTGTCSRTSQANASATESTAPPVGRPQNTSTA